MSTINATRLSNQRMTGMFSGLEVDDIVKKMLLNQQNKLNKFTQQKELINWQKDAYRSVISMLGDFQSKNLDILSPSSVLRPSNFTAMSASAPPYASEYFSVSAASGSYASSLTVDKITSLATAQKIETIDGHRITDAVMKLKDADVASLAGKSLNFNVNGETKTINIAATVTNADDFVADLNAKLVSAFGTTGGNPKVEIAYNPLALPDASGNRTLTLSALQGNTVQISGAYDVTFKLGFSGSIGNYMDMNTAAVGQNAKFSINGVEFSFDPTAKIKDVMAEINRSAAGVTMSYSAMTDKFIMTAKNTGSGDNIIMRDLPIVTTGAGGIVLSSVDTNFLEKLFGKDAYDFIGEVTHEGTDAVLTVNGTEIVRNSNNVAVDGITISLLKTTGVDFQAAAVSSKSDTAKVIDTIKNFVNEYNDLIDKLSKLVTEKRPKVSKSNSYYLPLTEDQRSAMNEKDIAVWEESGKRGLLYNDSALTRMIDNLKSAMFSSVEIESGGGKKISLASIGIKSASYFEDSNGKLQIDEDKLKRALENDPEAVMKLFTQTSSVPKDAQGDDMQKSRFNTLGIAQRFSEIFYKNINVSASEELRGALIRIAGTGGQNYLVDNQSYLQKKISNTDSTISRIQNKLYADEDRYYKKFAALETALAKLSKQSSYIYGFDSGGSNG